jgi:hypothetical protein
MKKNILKTILEILSNKRGGGFKTKGLLYNQELNNIVNYLDWTSNLVYYSKCKSVQNKDLCHVLNTRKW